MTCEEAKYLLMDYLYDEMNAENHLEFERHLKACESCSQELANFRQTSQQLQKWDDVPPALNLTFVDQQSRFSASIHRRWQGFFRLDWSWGRRLAVGLAVILLGFSLTNFKAEWKNGDFNVKMSLWPQAAEKQQIADLPLQQEELAAYQKEQLMLMNQMIKASEERQRKAMTMSLINFADELETRRKSDLSLVGTSFEQLQFQTKRELKQTRQSLDGLIKIMQVSSPQSNQKRRR